MDRGAWWATVHRIAESDTIEVTEHTCTGMIQDQSFKKSSKVLCELTSVSSSLYICVYIYIYIYICVCVCVCVCVCAYIYTHTYVGY